MFTHFLILLDKLLLFDIVMCIHCCGVSLDKGQDQCISSFMWNCLYEVIVPFLIIKSVTMTDQKISMKLGINEFFLLDDENL